MRRYIKFAGAKLLEFFVPKDRAGRIKLAKFGAKSVGVVLAVILYDQYREKKLLIEVAEQECKQMLDKQVSNEKRYI